MSYYNQPVHNNKCICCGHDIEDYYGPKERSLNAAYCGSCNGYPCYHCNGFISKENPQYTAVNCPSCGGHDIYIQIKDGWG